MASLGIYISPVIEELETSNLDSRYKSDSKGSIGRSTSGEMDAITFNHMTVTNLFISSYRGATAVMFGH